MGRIQSGRNPGTFIDVTLIHRVIPVNPTPVAVPDGTQKDPRRG